MTTRIRTAIVIDMVYMLQQAKKLGLLIDPSKMLDVLSKMLCFTAQGVVRFDAGTLIERHEVVAYFFNKNDDFSMKQHMEQHTSMGKFGLALEQAGITIESLKLHGSAEEMSLQHIENIELHVHSLLSQGKTVLVVGGKQLLRKTANTTIIQNLNFLSDSEALEQFPEINGYVLDEKINIFQNRKRTPYMVYNNDPREHAPQNHEHERIACCP